MHEADEDEQRRVHSRREPTDRWPSLARVDDPPDCLWLAGIEDRFGILGGKSLQQIHRRLVAGPKLERLLDHLFREAQITGSQTHANMTDAIRRHGPAIAERLWREGEAQSIFVACTLWSGELQPLRDAVPIPVLDPVQTLARYTELIAASAARR